MSRNPDFDAVMIKTTELEKLRADNAAHIEAVCKAADHIERLKSLLFRLRTSDRPKAAMLELIDAALTDTTAWRAGIEYPKKDAAPEVWIAWYRWKLEEMDRLLQGSYDDNARLLFENAAMRRSLELGR